MKNTIGGSMSKMRVVQVTKPNGPFELVEREVPEPGVGEVRIKVEACGICHSDSLTKEGLYPGIHYPRVSGHEVAGLVDAVGAGVVGWTEGQRVGVGWHGGYCGHCEPCRRGDFFACQWGQVTGITYDGGYADYMVAHSSALALLPGELSAIEAGPLVCAGVTTFNSLRNSGARPGDLVAVLGLGGLGHLGVQFAAKMGFQTIAIARGSEKSALAYELGAHHYIDSSACDVAAELQALGGARVVQATAANADAISVTIDGLAPHGELLTLAVLTDSLNVTPLQLIVKSATVHGHPGGVAQDVEDTMNFAQLQGIKPMVEVMRLDGG